MVRQYCRKIAFIGLCATLWSGVLAPPSARADCLNESLICLAVDYEPWIYGGCAIATNLEAAAMCWSWGNLECLPCQPQDNQACNAAVPDECKGNCEAVTGSQYYERCDETGRKLQSKMSSDSIALIETANKKPRKWTGTITPQGGKARPVVFFHWANAEDHHLRIEVNGTTTWAHKVVRKKNYLAFSFFENTEANCVLRSSGSGPYIGTCTEPKGGKAAIRMTPQG